MRLKSSIVAFSLILFIGMALASCFKPRTDTNDTDTSIAQNYSNIEQNNNEINNIVIEVMEKDTLTSLKTSDAGDLLSSCVNFHKTIYNDSIFILIDFGTNNCLCNDQKYRRGKIAIRALKNKTWAKAETIDFYVNDNRLEGSRILSKGSLLEISVKGSTKITLGDTATFTESFERTIMMTEGYLTPDVSDDLFSITGKTSGYSKNGSYTTEIVSPLKRKRTCLNIISGVLEIKPEGKLKRLVDFGNGDCDNLVTLSVGKYSKIISLK
ncbi:MAG: hypothetical protein NT150_09615 [Bacteroidetes bacterium]|nr:hypothetical protein [Bacteroidota bacterium]